MVKVGTKDFCVVGRILSEWDGSYWGSSWDLCTVEAWGRRQRSWKNPEKWHGPDVLRCWWGTNQIPCPWHKPSFLDCCEISLGDWLTSREQNLDKVNSSIWTGEITSKNSGHIKSIKPQIDCEWSFIIILDQIALLVLWT